METLRPIGTRFTHVFPASMFTTSDAPSRHTFEVVGHSECAEGPWEGAKTYMAEEVKCIAVERLPEPEVIPLRAFKSVGHWQEWASEYANQFA